MKSLLLASLILLFQSPPPPPMPTRVGGAIPQDGEGLIDGVVRRSNSDDPISGARVNLYGPPGATGVVETLNTLTGNDGRFTFEKLPAGRYTVAAQRDGYVPRRTLAGVDTPSVVVNPGKSATAVVLRLIQGGTISGRILDPAGRPAVSAVVTAARQVYQNGRPALGPVKSTSSDDRGEYRLFSLEPGEYVVLAEKGSPTGATRGYFPGGDDGRAALGVVVSEGGEASRTDFSLATITASVTISGVVNVVIPASPNAPTTTLVQQFFLIPTEESRLYEGLTAFTNALTSEADLSAGKFELRNVRTGAYELFAVLQDRGVSPARTFMAHQPVEVGTKNIEGIALTVRPGMDLKGTIRGSGGNPPPDARVHIRPVEALPNWTGATAVVRDGSFSFSNVPEFEYTVSVEPLDPNAYVAELLQGRDSILHRGVMTVARGFADNLEAVIQSPASTILGTVESTPAQRASGIMITLVPEESRRENLALYKRVLTLAHDGAFSLVGVSPGKYTLFAWEDIPDGAEFSPLFLRRFKDSGEEVVVSAGGTSPVELRLIPK